MIPLQCIDIDTQGCCSLKGGDSILPKVLAKQPNTRQPDAMQAVWDLRLYALSQSKAPDDACSSPCWTQVRTN